MTKEIAAVVFDAYGTLFDVYAVGATAEALYPGHGAQIAELWRVAQIDYTRLRTLCGQYIDFWQITSDALGFATAKLGLELTTKKREELLGAYERLRAFDENLDVLQALKSAGLPLAILSNGTPQMLKSAIQAANMEGLFDHVLSVETVKKFKTAPEAYQLGPDAFGVPAKNILFVSSNGWDVCGATWFGYHSFWVNRAGNVLDHLGVSAHSEGRNLKEVARYLGVPHE